MIEFEEKDKVPSGKVGGEKSQRSSRYTAFVTHLSQQPLSEAIKKLQKNAFLFQIIRSRRTGL